MRTRAAPDFIPCLRRVNLSKVVAARCLPLSTMKTFAQFPRFVLALVAVSLLALSTGCKAPDEPKNPGPHQRPAAEGKDGPHETLMGNPGPHQ